MPLLADLKALKDQLQITAASDDDFLTRTLTVASAMVESFIGRSVKEATYTETLDGSGQRSLQLTQGPGVSVTSVKWVSYASDGTPTKDTLQAGEYFLGGLRTEGHLGAAWLDGNGFDWTTGQRNIEVIYVAGFAAVPEDIQQCVIDISVWMKNRRKDSGDEGRDVGDGILRFRAPKEMETVMALYLNPYCSGYGVRTVRSAFF